MKRTGAWVLCMGLCVVGCDSDGDVDAGTDSAITLPDSGGGGVDSGPTGCAPLRAPAALNPQACLAETLDCLIAAGTDGAAQQACFEADPRGMDCITCIVTELDQTATNNASCAQQLGDLSCCVDTAGCGGVFNLQCRQTAAMGACSTQAAAYNSCIMGCASARTCGNSMNGCFMPRADGGVGADGGGGTPDAGAGDDASVPDAGAG